MHSSSSAALSAAPMRPAALIRGASTKPICTEEISFPLRPASRSRGVQADKVRMLQRGQPAGDDGAVFAGHLHDVRHRADSRQRAVPGKRGSSRSGPPRASTSFSATPQPAKCLKGYAQSARWGSTTATARGSDLAALVVVSDDHVQPQ